MLPSSRRLSTDLFKKTLEKGLVFHSPLFIIYVLKTLNISRFSVSIPKKITKKAVLRNKIRRRIYAIIKNFELRTILGKNVVIVSKNGCQKMSFIKLSEELEKIFVKSGLLK